jgi:hypothetical protein
VLEDAADQNEPSVPVLWLVNALLEKRGPMAEDIRPGLKALDLMEVEFQAGNRVVAGGD